jgi:hypothetical protein
MKCGLCLLILGGVVMSAYAHTPPPGRPPALGVQANIVWLYYKDVPAAQRFYPVFLEHPQNAKLLTALKTR